MNPIIQFMKRNYKALLVVIAISVAMWSFIPKEKASDPEKDKLLIEQEKQLNEAEMKSAKAENELQIANEQIKKLKKSNEVTENSLKKTRELFNEYEKETERAVKIKTRQRNFWIFVSAVAVGKAFARR